MLHMDTELKDLTNNTMRDPFRKLEQRFMSKLPRHPPHTKLCKFVNSKIFQCFSAVLILSNAFFVGHETDARFLFATAGRPLGNYFRPINVAFTVIFVLELSLKIAGERLWCELACRRTGRWLCGKDCR